MQLILNMPVSSGKAHCADVADGGQVVSELSGE
jgi:hypothetical protein